MRQPESEVFQIDPEAKEAHDQALLVAEGRTHLLMETPDGRVTQLPTVLDHAVKVLAAGLANGRAVLVADDGSTVSPTTAATLLGVSRPMVTRWITEGLLPDLPVGSHHRIPITSVLSLRDTRTQAGYRAMAVMDAAGSTAEATARVGAARSRAKQRVSARKAG
jgi:excisionase family DNA binding protein